MGAVAYAFSSFGHTYIVSSNLLLGLDRSTEIIIQPVFEATSRMLFAIRESSMERHQSSSFGNRWIAPYLRHESYFVNWVNRGPERLVALFIADGDMRATTRKTWLGKYF